MASSRELVLDKFAAELFISFSHPMNWNLNLRRENKGYSWQPGKNLGKNSYGQTREYSYYCNISYDSSGVIMRKEEFVKAGRQNLGRKDSIITSPPVQM